LIIWGLRIGFEEFGPYLLFWNSDALSCDLGILVVDSLPTDFGAYSARDSLVIFQTLRKEVTEDT